MKIYIQTEIVDPAANTAEQRPPVLLRETAADGARAAEALEAVSAKLGTRIAIPPAAHESNLKTLLNRDLADLPEGPGEEGRTTLKVRRTPIENAEGYELSYSVSQA